MAILITPAQLHETRRGLLTKLEKLQEHHSEIDAAYKISGDNLNYINEQLRSVDRMILAFAVPVPVGYKNPGEK